MTAHTTAETMTTTTSNRTAPVSCPPAFARAGFTVIEALIVISVLGLFLGIAIPRFRGLGNDLENAAMETAAFIRQTRAKALSTTSAYRIVFESDTRLRAEFAAACDATAWTEDRRVTLRLRERTTVEGDGLDPDDTVLCFDSRGVADASPTLTMRDDSGAATDVEVFIGGGVRVIRGGADE